MNSWIATYGDRLTIFLGLVAVGLMALQDIPHWLSQTALVLSVIANAAHKAFYSKSGE